MNITQFSSLILRFVFYNCFLCCMLFFSKAYSNDLSRQVPTTTPFFISASYTFPPPNLKYEILDKNDAFVAHAPQKPTTITKVKIKKSNLHAKNHGLLKKSHLKYKKNASDLWLVIFLMVLPIVCVVAAPFMFFLGNALWLKLLAVGFVLYAIFAFWFIVTHIAYPTVR